MIIVRVPLGIVTPLFLGGSEPRGAPELRPASFRGALRYWLRTLLGAHLGDSALDGLRKEETKVFGDASQDSGSPVIVRVSTPPQPEHFGAPGPANMGLRYLFFSMGQRERDPRTGQTITTWRDCFAAGSTFELILQTRSPGWSEDQEITFKRALAALWLLVRLGGLGARSRRGAGSLRAIAQPAGWPEKLPPLPVQAATPAALKAELEKCLRNLRDATGLLTDGRVHTPSAFDVLHPAACDIRVLEKTWPTWENALEAVGAAFQGFRNRYQPDYSNVKDVVGGRSQRLEPVHRAAFGLPIVFYFRSLGAQGMLEGAEHDRRASPLLFKAVQLADGQYTVVLTVFRATLLDSSERLRLRLRGRPAFAATPSLDLVDEFLDALSTRGNYFVAPLLEVDYR
jgi:CRISPR-associated protein Cmr1